MNSNQWLCDKSIENGYVKKNAKCEIICRDGFDVVSGLLNV